MTDKNVRTIADIARLAGVSKSTVSRALNGSSLISEETRERIQTIATECCFQINLPARRLSMRQSNTLAFVMNGFCGHLTVDDLFTLEIMGTISNETALNDYDLLLAHIDPYDPNWPNAYLNTGRVDGFILMTSTRKQNHIKALLDINAPFIVWGTPMQDYSYCSVNGDSLTGGYLATKHLIEIGRRRIGFIGGPEFELEVQQRKVGYERAMREAGLEIRPEWVTFGDYTTSSGWETARALLEVDPKLEAIFLSSDMMAFAAVKAIQETGRRIPDDIAIVGFDDISIAEHSNPPLTTIRQNISAIGKTLVHNLIEYLHTGVVTNTMMPVELVVRGSTVR